MTGYIKLSRKILQDDIWLKKPMSRGQVWVDLLLLAEWKPGYFYKKTTKIEYKRGQVTLSVKGLASRWGWSMNKVWRFLKCLKNENQIEYQKSNLTSKIQNCMI